MTIELKEIAKSYTDQDVILEKINCTINTGEFFVLVGPSGCGKSTLLRMIAGLIPVSAGDIVIDEQLATELPPKERKLSMVFQNYALLPFLSVADNIAFGLQAENLSASEQADRINEALALVNLTAFQHRKPKDLSGGQQQRVALARAVASKAPICLMDEPLSNLDAQLRAKMRSEIRALQQRLGLTLIYVTHDQVEAMTMGDRVMVLNDKHIQQVGTPLDLYNNPANRFVAEFIGAPQMNFVTAERLRDNHRTRLSIANQLELTINNDLTADTYEIGIRPEKLTIVDQPNQATLAAQILSIQQLGNSTLVRCQIADQSLVVSLNYQYNGTIGNVVYIQLPPATGLLLFDSASGTRLTNWSNEEVAVSAS